MQSPISDFPLTINLPLHRGNNLTNIYFFWYFPRYFYQNCAQIVPLQLFQIDFQLQWMKIFISLHHSAYLLNIVSKQFNHNLLAQCLYIFCKCCIVYIFMNTFLLQIHQVSVIKFPLLCNFPPSLILIMFFLCAQFSLNPLLSYPSLKILQMLLHLILFIQSYLGSLSIVCCFLKSWTPTYVFYNLECSPQGCFWLSSGPSLTFTLEINLLIFFQF